MAKQKLARHIDPKYFKVGAVWKVDRKTQWTSFEGLYQIKGKSSNGNRYLERIEPPAEYDKNKKIEWNSRIYTTCLDLIEGVGSYNPIGDINNAAALKVLYSMDAPENLEELKSNSHKGFDIVWQPYRQPKWYDPVVRLFNKIKELICVNG